MNKKYVYMGPDRPFGLPLRHRAILAGEPEAVFPPLAALFASHKNFHRLFVPVDNLAAALRAAKNPGSALSIHSNEIRAASEAAGTAPEKAAASTETASPAAEYAEAGNGGA